MRKVLFIYLMFSFWLVNAQSKDTIKFKPNKVYSQSFIDSLINNPMIIIKVEDYKKILLSNTSLLGWPRYYYGKMILSYKEKNYDSVINYANEGIKCYEDAKNKRPIDEKILIPIYLIKGKALSLKREHKASIVNLEKSLNLTKKYPYKWKSYILTDIAKNHLEIGNDSIALKKLLLTTKDSLYFSIPINPPITYNYIGLIYKGLKKNDSAKFYFKKGIEFSNNSTYKKNLAALYGNLGLIAKNENKLDSTIYYFKKSINAFNKHKVNYENSTLYKSFYKNYIRVQESKNTKKAIKELNVILDKLKNKKHKNKDDKDLFISVIETLGVAYEKSNIFSAYKNLINESTTYLNTFHKNQLKTDLNKLEIQYQTKEKEASIIQLRETQAQQLKIIRQQKILFFSLLTGLVLLIFIGLLYRKQILLKNKYQKESLKQRLLRSQMNPHFVSNSLNSISSYVNRKSDKTTDYINKLSLLFRSILINSEEEFIYIKDEITILNNYLELQSNFSTSFDFSINVSKELNQENLIIPPMMIQPFIENAIVHGLKKDNLRGLIKVEFLKRGELIHVKINDNGIGYNSQLNEKKELKNDKSFSIEIIKQRLNIINRKHKTNASFSINSKYKKGTCIDLYLPYLVD